MAVLYQYTYKNTSRLHAFPESREVRQLTLSDFSVIYVHFRYRFSGWFSTNNFRRKYGISFANFDNSKVSNHIAGKIITTGIKELLMML